MPEEQAPYYPWEVAELPPRHGETPEQYLARAREYLDRTRPMPPWWAYALFAALLGGLVVAAWLH